MLCPFCKEQIQDGAVKCRYCGEFFDGRARTGDWNPRIAGLLSFLIVGMGQIYKGQPKRWLTLFAIYAVCAFCLTIDSKGDSVGVAIRSLITACLTLALWVFAIFDAITNQSATDNLEL